LGKRKTFFLYGVLSIPLAKHVRMGYVPSKSLEDKHLVYLQHLTHTTRPREGIQQGFVEANKLMREFFYLVL